MAITSSEIQNQTFSIDRKGYDVDEVDVFLERLSNEVDEMNATIMQYEDEIESNKFAGYGATAPNALKECNDEKDVLITKLQNELEEKKANDNAIAQALIIAQRSADEIIMNANQEAAHIRQDAEDEAQRILDKANGEKQRIVDAIAKLESDREDAREEYQDILKDFISDATKKLNSLGIDSGPRSFAHGRSNMDATGKSQVPFRKNSSTSTYTTPQTSASAIISPATPKPSSIEKDLSGFGDADDDFDFEEVD